MWLRVRPALIEAFLASIGFIRMEMSTTPGAEGQRPLSIVVIGGLISANALTFIVLPIVYGKFVKKIKS